MKTTVELPEALVKQIKLRAVQEGRKLKDAVADLLRQGLAATADRPRAAAVIGKDGQTGLPVILCEHAASPQAEMTAERVAEILSTQEAHWHHVPGR